MSERHKEDFFSRFTTKVSAALGQPGVFVGAVVVLIAWAISGPFLGFSDTWQLIINTGTTIVTFLMVFIIQNTQNRDNLAINLKLEALMLELKSPTPSSTAQRRMVKKTSVPRQRSYGPKRKNAALMNPKLMGIKNSSPDDRPSPLLAVGGACHHGTLGRPDDRQGS